MSTTSIIVIVLLVVAFAIFLAWGTRKRIPANHGKQPAYPNNSSEEPTASPPAPPTRSIPDLSGMTLDKERDSDPEITMMGRVPEEVLAIMQGKLSGDVTIEVEESYDIDIADLFDGFEEEEITGKHALILLVGVARSDRGRRRQCNEDAFLILADEHLFVVADGMGGHNAGEVASQLAVDSMAECFRDKNFPGEPKPDWPRRGDELVRSIHWANQAIFEKAQERDDYKGMGTTVVAVRFSPNKQRAYIAHVGDSRCYRIRNGELHQLTEDHTLGRLMGATGKAARHLAQAVGVRTEVAVDLTVDEPQPGDRYLVCSDGLTKMLDDDALLKLALEDDELDARCQALIAEANERGGRDNITVIIVRVDKPALGDRAKKEEE